MVKINIAFNKQTTKNQFFKKKKYIYTLFESASSIKKLVRILFWKSYIEFRGLLLELDIRCINNIQTLVLDVLDAHINTESVLQTMFYTHRSYGEWFGKILQRNNNKILLFAVICSYFSVWYRTKTDLYS